MTAAPIEMILWRGLETPGHDACRVEQAVLGWRIDGTATLRHDGRPAVLAYRVACDADWKALRGTVTGFVGQRAVECHVERAADGAWSMNGRGVAGLEDCVDLDLGFTPATNTCVLRRLSLAVGEKAEAPAAFLDVSTGTLKHLIQRYERRSQDRYWYEAPLFGYSATLSVSPAGLVLAYPGLFEVER